MTHQVETAIDFKSDIELDSNGRNLFINNSK